MSTLQPIGWLAAYNTSDPSGLWNRPYVLSSNERSTGTAWSNFKVAVFQVSASSSTELTVSAQITAPSGDELGGLQCYVFSVPTNISASYPVTIYEYMKLAEQHTAETSSTFTFNVTHSGYLGVCITDYRVGSINQALKINSVSYGSDSDPGSGSGTGTTTPTQQNMTITARPSSPSGNNVAFDSDTVFTWSISSLPDDRIYQGTKIQLTTGSDPSGSNLIFDHTVDGFVTTYRYTGTINPNSDYIWRAKAIVNGTETSNSTPEVEEILLDEEGNLIISGGGSLSSATETIVSLPWSDWQPFHTKDYEQVSVSVTTSSPENNASFVHGKQISFRWSISGGSNVTINSSTIMVDGSALATVNGNTTSYTLYESEAKALGVGTHQWYVIVDCSTTSSGVQLVGSPESERSTFTIASPVATANPSSPSGSTSVYADAAVTFTWSISKNGDGNYTGSQLEYRYSNQSAWTFLGETEHGVTTFTYDRGFRANTVVQWHVRTSLDGRYGDNGGWSDQVSFSVGNVEEYSATPTLVQPKGTVAGDKAITFAWTVKSSGSVGGCVAEYSIDGGISWKSLGSYTIEGETYLIRKSAGELTLPAGTVYWHVKASGNGEYSSWSESSFTVSYDAYGNVVVSSAPINKGARRDQSIAFAAELDIIGSTTEDIVFSEASFHWKMDSGTEYQEERMTVSGTSASVTFPAYKFPSGILQWYLTARDSKDNDSETALYASYILVSAIDTFPLAPTSIVHDVTQALSFRWGFISQNQHLSTGSEIRFSVDGVNWDEAITLNATISSNTVSISDPLNMAVDDLLTGTGYYLFTENYFSTGVIYWQIRSRSSDGVFGEWSASSSFIVRGLPQVRNFACNRKPFATFTWSVNEQVSYEIVIDETLRYGPFHGEERSFTLTEPLEDGNHTASLQIQNQLSAISKPLSINFTVQNESTASTYLKLYCQAGVDAVLSWHPLIISDDNEFLVYCDDRLIARLPSDVTSYTDRLTLGEHDYKVIQRLTSGDYDLYWHSAVAMHSETTRVTRLDGGPWISLVLTSEQYPVNNFTHAREIEKTKVMGTKYPVIEVGEFEEDSGEYEVCWPYENYSQIGLFKALTGQAIIIKSRGDQVICGVLESCSFAVNSQYIKCTFTLEQMSTDIDLSIATRPELDNDFMTNLDRIYFGQFTAAALGLAATNPGYTNPNYYEDIAEAINERLRAARLLD